MLRVYVDKTPAAVWTWLSISGTGKKAHARYGRAIRKDVSHFADVLVQHGFDDTD